MKTHFFQVAILTLCMNATFSNAQIWQEVGLVQNQSSVNQNIATDGQDVYISYLDGQTVDSKVTVRKYNGVSWNLVGAQGLLYGGTFDSEGLEVSSGTPYLTGLDDQLRAIVLKYNGTDWVQIGLPVSDSSAAHPCIEVENDTLYVAFYDFNNDGITVKKFDGSNWNTIGTEGFTFFGTNFVSFAVENGVPYVACQEQLQLNVLSFDGTNWNYLGGQDISQAGGSDIHILIENGTPYVLYADWQADQMTLLSYDGSSWLTVGASSMPIIDGIYTGFIFHNGEPYISFRDLNSKISVIRYDGANWNFVGSSEFSDGVTSHTSIAFVDDIPYVSYRDGANSSVTTVQKFDFGVGLDEDEYTPFEIYPNPSSSFIHIKSLESIESINIFDNRGTVHITSVDSNIEVTDLVDGIYLLQITTRSGVYTRRFIKQ